MSDRYFDHTGRGPSPSAAVPSAFLYTSTYLFGALSCEAGIAVLDVYERDDAFAKMQRAGERLIADCRSRARRPPGAPMRVTASGNVFFAAHRRLPISLKFWTLNSQTKSLKKLIFSNQLHILN
jgi:hypothetical protein